MSATPRPRSGAFPHTPATAPRGAPPTPTPTPPSARSSTRSAARSPLPLAPQDNTNNGAPAAQIQPLIPLTVLDAPTQRIYACGVYVALLAWRFYDWVQLVEDNTESFWLLLKWLAIDGVFLFGLPELRIPWLELAQPVVVGLFLFHAVFDWMLMFNIPLPWSAWLLGIVKVLYDRELAISENYVKTSNILHNSSLITGRQIINILPEGSAVLNPEGVPFCLGGDQTVAILPLHFNATVPVEVELIRTDLNTNEEESVKLSRGQIRDIERMTKRSSLDGKPVAIQYDLSVKKPGAYRLGRVLDEYKLEVQRRSPYSFIVPCPKARVGPSPSSNRCLGDLSDLSLQVDGTPPLKIVYSRTINGKDHSFHFQSLQPDGFSSPLLGSPPSTSLVSENEDISWARSQRVTVGLNESMHIGGDWQYSIDEVHDAFGNVVKYVSPSEDPEMRPKPKHLGQNFLVKERPKLHLQGCDMRNPLKVAKGKATNLPVKLGVHGKPSDASTYSLTWQFSPIDSLTKNGDHGDIVSTASFTARKPTDKPSISAPGLYTLKTVSSDSCEGEIQEPSSCLLLNPLEPRLTLRSEDIPDSCAGNSIGLRVDLDLIGTPPFVVRYDVVTNGEPRRERVDIPGMRYQLELVPRVAGHHKYIFKTIDDAIYKDQILSGAGMALEQSVKPIARAMISHPTGKIKACLEEEIGVEIALLGEPPFNLEYEVLHEGRRQRFDISDIKEHKYEITTPSLVQGGEYSLVLTSVQDNKGCKNFVQDELKIHVNMQRPRASFGAIENKRKTMVIEEAKVKLPVRLTGEGPWRLGYRVGDSPEIVQQTMRSGNDFIEVSRSGSYEVVDIWDNQCHGVIDKTASTFEVGWFPRPELSLVQKENLSKKGDKYVKQDVCEGDIDGVEVFLKGSPPYHVEYDVRHKPHQGSSSISHKDLDAALGRASIQMDTAKAGLYTYKFSTLSDSLYDMNKRKFSPLVLEQTVNARPSAAFVKPGQTFKYCASEQENGDRIPIALTGIPPFYLEMEVKHSSGSIPETYRIPSIATHNYGMQIPRQYLRLGTQHIRIREVRDSRGCLQKTESGGPSVQVQLFDPPAIYALETRTDYCVGERISYTLSGTPPFEVWYTFDGNQRKGKSATTNFRRLAEAPGEFAITTISDKASECRAAVNITKAIHPMPSVRISKGRNARVDIHEGGEVEILFEFGGTPPFEFTYIRSTNPKKGAKSQVLETRHDTSYEHSKVIRASQEGTYEVVAIKDKFCAYSTQQLEAKEGQKMLTY